MKIKVKKCDSVSTRQGKCMFKQIKSDIVTRVFLSPDTGGGDGGQERDDHEAAEAAGEKSRLFNIFS